ncbi:hypothetical protein [Vibrio cincinnatiensis]|nr:hypothetical protein [Vibrio cincinnatiensis]
MALNKKTLTPILVTSGITLLLLAAINNVGALAPVRDFVQPKKEGWF